jgi:hypothetical protein
MRKILLLLSFLPLSLFAQQLISQDFTSGTVGNAVTASPISWSTNGSGSNTFTISNAATLSYTGYTLGGGNCVSVARVSGTNNVGQTFSVTSGTNTIYYSFLLNVSTVGSGFFVALLPSIASSSYFAKVFMQSATGGYNLGISKTAGTGTFGTKILATGTTHLIVVRYSFATGGTTNDLAYLWIDPVGSSEPLTANAEASDISGTDASALSSNGCFTLRENTSTPVYYFDGLLVANDASSATAWSDLGVGTLPVELKNFNSRVDGKSVSLNWNTATEANSYGFKVLRSSDNQQTWNDIGFVKGAGNSSAPLTYSFTDRPNAGTHTYKLQVLDNDGSYKFSKEVTATVGAAERFSLNQNYPNPFNPSTVISYTLPVDARVSLKIYNLLGTEVAELINGNQAAGSHSVQLDSDKYHLASGVYLYKLTSGSFSETRRMLLLK